MKKLLVLFVLLIQIVAYSQTKEIVCSNYPTADERINKEVQNMYNAFTSFGIKTDAIWGDKSDREINQIIQQLQSGDTSLYAQLPPAFFLDYRKTILNFVNATNNALSLIANNNPRWSQQEVVAELGQVYGCYVKLKTNEEASSVVKMADPCLEDKIDCFAIVASASVACHYACVPADATLIGGVICHGACLTGQWAGGRKCNRDYRRCLENKN